MADEHRPTVHDDPTQVSGGVDPTSPQGTGSPSGTPAAPASSGWSGGSVEHIDVPRSDPSGAAAQAAQAAQAAAAAAQAAAEQAAQAARAAAPGGPATGTPASGTPETTGPGARPGGADGDTASFRARAAERTAEGAKAAADRAQSAASATVQALRETDVHEIAQSTTSLIENTRPFFLTAFAIGFAFLAAIENHAAVGVMFGIGAVLCVLGAAYSRELDLLLTGRAGEGRGARRPRG